MNIDDIKKEVEAPDGPIILTIFNLQLELMKKYDEIEKRNGFQVPSSPYHIDNNQVQARIKDLFWRATEELAEALETTPSLVALKNWSVEWDKDSKIRHFFEEIADAVHFLVEASLVGGGQFFAEGMVPFMDNRLPVIKKPPFNCPSYNHLDLLAWKIVYHMGLAANCLKNKPWKVTQMSTDSQQFRLALLNSWEAFCQLWKSFGGSQEELYILYAKKNLVNQWRQETNY